MTGAPPPGQIPNMTEQEKFLMMIHQNNMLNPAVNPDGSISTIRSVGFEQGGKNYTVPSVWQGAVHPPEEAIQRAMKHGIDKYPSYSTQKESETRYDLLHKLMEQDAQKKK